MTSRARALQKGFDAPRQSPLRAAAGRSVVSASAACAVEAAIHRCAVARPSTGIVAPGANGHRRRRRASCSSIQSRCSSAQRAPSAAGAPRAGELQRAARPRRTAGAAAAPGASGGFRSGAGARASSAASERPVDHMIFKLAGIDLADRPAARRLAGFMDRLATSGDEIMPFGQRLARRAQAVGAGLGQPVEAGRDYAGRAGRNRRPAACGVA